MFREMFCLKLMTDKKQFVSSFISKAIFKSLFENESLAAWRFINFD